MGRNIPDAFDSSLQKSNLWLKDVQQAARLRSRFQAYSAVRVVLHALRDCLPAAHAVKLSAQMPLLLKGIFFDGWRLAPKPHRLDRDQFFGRLRNELAVQPEIDPSLALEAVIVCLYRHLSPDAIDRALFVLPREIRTLIREVRADLPRSGAVRPWKGERRGAGGPRRPVSPTERQVRAAHVPFPAR